MGPTPFLATAFSEGASVSWWQSLGGLMAVLALLVVFLKLLGRVNRRMSGDQASVVKVWPLGPRREIQVLRLGEEVHFIYRHDGAMVLLRRARLLGTRPDSVHVISRPERLASIPLSPALSFR